MNIPFEQEIADVLQNVEAAIVHLHRREPELLDYDVDAALEALVKRHRAEQEGRTAPDVALDGRRRQAYEVVREVCEWRLGREPLGETPPLGAERNTPEQIVLCLKRIRKSVPRWTKQRGRRGYLEFVAQYV